MTRKNYIKNLFFVLIALTFFIPALSSFAKENPATMPQAVAKKLVAIDPGHGGKDIGCMGEKGIAEKEITLKLAFILKEILSKNPKLNVLITRTEDIEISTEKRVSFANSNKADIFLSLHVNASFDRNQKGVEIYYYSEDSLGFSYSQSQNEGLTPQESEDKKTPAIYKWDEVQKMFSMKGFELASFLEESIKSSTEISFRSVNPAPLFATTGAAMPAVVIEAGFITNPQEEASLSRDGYLKVLALKIADGIIKYTEDNE